MRRSALTIVVSALIAFAALDFTWQRTARTGGFDFYQFWVGSRSAPHEANLYAADTGPRLGREYLARAIAERSRRMEAVAMARSRIELFSTPFLYTCFGALRGSYDGDIVIYRALSAAALVIAFVLLGASAGLRYEWTLLILAYALLLFEPLKTDWRVVNVNQLQLLGVALYVFLARRRPALAGFVICLAVSFKPNLAIALPLIVIARFAAGERKVLAREVGGMAAGGAAAVIASSIYFGSIGAWVQWIGAARSLSAGLLPRSSGNVAPAYALVASFGTAAAYALTIILLAIAGLALWRGRGKNVVVAAALGPLIYLLSAPLVWLHYVVLAIPLIFLLLAPGNCREVRIGALVALLLLGVDVCVPFFIVAGHVKTEWPVAVGLLLLFASAVWQLWGESERPPVSSAVSS